MAQVEFSSYEQNGKKLSFANWISNISPEDTPFVSMTGKESIDQVLFQWQVDSLAAANRFNAQPEGFVATAYAHKPTQTIFNRTQLLSKVVSVSDTANATANYGRGRELMYQLEKAGAEIKRDLEAIFLHNGTTSEATTGNPSVPGTNPPGSPGLVTPTANQSAYAAGLRTTGGVKALIGRHKGTGAGAANVGTVNVDAAHDGLLPDEDFGAIVRKAITKGATFGADLFALTLELYKAGSKANVIMIHPVLATEFSALQEKGDSDGNATRVRIFENRKDIDVQVNVITDPLGQKFRVVYNRHMPVDGLFIFNPADWTQMVLRAPQRTELAKNGDSTQYMITMETGLRHRNPYASAWGTVK